MSKMDFTTKVALPMNKDLFTRRFLGEVFPEPKTFQSFPFAPSPMPATATTKHVYLVISDFVANTFLHSVKVKGIANQTFSASDDYFINSALSESSGKKMASSAYTHEHLCKRSCPSVLRCF